MKSIDLPLKALQTISDNCCDYLEIHDSKWPTISLALTASDKYGDCDLKAPYTINLNRELCRRDGVDILSVLFHEIGHLKVDVEFAPRCHQERFADVYEKLLTDLHFQGAF